MNVTVSTPETAQSLEGMAERAVTQSWYASTMLRMNKILVFFLYAGFLICFSHLYGAEQVVLYGTPVARVDSSKGETKKLQLSPQESYKYRLLVVKRNGRYFWASRDYKSLVHSISGAFHYFIALDGSGYIKIVDRRLLFERKDPRFVYLEHVSLWLDTITYWGEAKAFSP